MGAMAARLRSHQLGASANLCRVNDRGVIERRFVCGGQLSARFSHRPSLATRGGKYDPRMSSSGEQLVLERLRAALPSPPYRLYPNVRWISKADVDSPARDGETDLLIVHPDDGLLIVETKGGPIRRDGQGGWWSRQHQLLPPPFTQAENSKHALRRKLASIPDWPGSAMDIRMGHAVAFPDVSVRGGPRAIGLGPDAPLELVIDQSDLSTDGGARLAVARAYHYWLGDRRRGNPLNARQLELIDEMLAPTTDLKPLLRLEVEEGERQVVKLTRAQMHTLDTLRGQRRAAIVGPAETGKTILAREKARRLAAEGSGRCSSASISPSRECWPMSCTVCRHQAVSTC